MRDEGEKEQERQQIQDIGKTLQFMQRKRNLHHFEEKHRLYLTFNNNMCIHVYYKSFLWKYVSKKSKV